MDLDTLQHWVLLRPLVLFLLACPCLVLVVLVGRKTAQRREKRSRKAHMVRRSAVHEDAIGGPRQFHVSEEFVAPHTEACPGRASRTVVEDQPIDRTKATAAEQLARPRAEAGWPGERGGGQPRSNCGLLALGKQMNDSARRSSLGQWPNCGLLALGEQMNGPVRRSSLGQWPNCGLLALGQQVDDSLPGSSLSQQPLTRAAGAQSNDVIAAGATTQQIREETT